MSTGGELRGARLVFVSVYYAPEETGIAPYTTAMAEHCASRGADVTAVVGMPHYPAWEVDPGYRGRMRSREYREGVHVRRVRVFVPRRQTALRRAAYEATFLANGLLATGRGRVDGVIGVVPSLSGGALAAALAARRRCPLGLVVQDLTGPAAAQSGMPGGGSVARATRAAEAWVLRQADEIAVVSDGFRSYIAEQGVSEDRVTTLRNWSRMPSPTGVPAVARAALGWAPDTTIVLHAGNMGLKQGLEHVIAAARTALVSHPSVRFVLMGNGSQRRALEASAVDLPNVSFTESRYGTEFADALAAADILLVNERSSVLDMSLPSKLTSYFVAGRPVVAAVAEAGVTAREIERSGGGIVARAENPDALLAAVARLVHDSELASRLGVAGQRYAAEHLHESTALSRAEDFVNRLLAGRGASMPVRLSA